jgi:hypothetical protein
MEWVRDEGVFRSVGDVAVRSASRNTCRSFGAPPDEPWYLKGWRPRSQRPAVPASEGREGGS